MSISKIVIIGAGVGGLTTAALLAKAGFEVTVLESQSYPGGSAGTFFHKGYRFDAGATVVGGFQANGPHAIAAEKLGITFDVRAHDPAWVVHLPDRTVALTGDNADVIANFPQSAAFWKELRVLWLEGPKPGNSTSPIPTNKRQNTRKTRGKPSSIPCELITRPFPSSKTLISATQPRKYPCRSGEK